MLKKMGLIGFLLINISGCANYMHEHEINQKAPSGFSEVITKRKLAKIKPVDVISLLKGNCCNAVLIETSTINFWNDQDIIALEPFLKDDSEAAPVSEINGSISCRGARYASSVSREAKHLIAAYKKKKYPLAQCSTYDLKLE